MKFIKEMIAGRRTGAAGQTQREGHADDGDGSGDDTRDVEILSSLTALRAELRANDRDSADDLDDMDLDDLDLDDLDLDDLDFDDEGFDDGRSEGRHGTPRRLAGPSGPLARGGADAAAQFVLPRTDDDDDLDDESGFDDDLDPSETVTDFTHIAAGARSLRDQTRASAVAAQEPLPEPAPKAAAGAATPAEAAGLAPRPAPRALGATSAFRAAATVPAPGNGPAAQPESGAPRPAARRIWDIEAAADQTADAAPAPNEAAAVELPRHAQMPPPRPAPEAAAQTDGSGAPRAGRVKTRLLGFEHSRSANLDPFDTTARNRTVPEARFPVGWIVVVRGPGRGASFTLFNGVSQIGRGDDQIIKLDFGDNSISRSNHAAIAYDEEQGAFFIGHGGKANLVRLNDTPVLSTERLDSGDTIRIGETTLRFIALCGQEFRWDRDDEAGTAQAAIA